MFLPPSHPLRVTSGCTKFSLCPVVICRSNGNCNETHFQSRLIFRFQRCNETSILELFKQKTKLFIQGTASKCNMVIYHSSISCDKITEFSENAEFSENDRINDTAASHIPLLTCTSSANNFGDQPGQCLSMTFS